MSDARLFRLGAVKTAMDASNAGVPLRFPLQPQLVRGVAAARLAATFVGVSSAARERALQTASRLLAVPAERIELLSRDGDDSATVLVRGIDGGEIGRRYVEGIDWETGAELSHEEGALEAGNKVAMVKFFSSVESPPVLLRGTVVEVIRGTSLVANRTGGTDPVIVPKKARVRWATGGLELVLVEKLFVTGAEQALEEATRAWRAGCRESAAGTIESLRTQARVAREQADKLKLEADTYDERADALVAKWGPDGSAKDCQDLPEPRRRGRPPKGDR